MAKYYLIHWGASLSDTEKQMALAWVKNQREAFYPNLLADAKWSNEAIRPIQDSVAVDMRKVILGNLLSTMSVCHRTIRFPVLLATV